MTQKDTIFKRKSHRKYEDRSVEDEVFDQIRSFLSQAKPLYPDISWSWEIWPRERFICPLPWLPPQTIVIFSEKSPGYLENIGFIFQQLDLFLQQIGLGSCWLGMGKPKNKADWKNESGLNFAMMLTFGVTRDLMREGPEEFKRHPLEKICDEADEALEVARLAPSAINSQPWYFTHRDDKILVWRKKGILNAHLNEMNQIDMGIALAHLYIANPHTFSFSKADSPTLAGHEYIGTVKLI